MSDKTYKVTITETLQMEVEIEANSAVEAEEICEEKWNKEEFVLAAEHFKGVDFKAKQLTKDRSNER